MTGLGDLLPKVGLILLGGVGSWVVSIAWDLLHYKLWPTIIRARRPTIARLKREILKKEGFEFKRVREGLLPRTRYYTRETMNDPSDHQPSYLFFTDERIRLEEFKAFFIPTLDKAHGLRHSVSLALNKHWEKYLSGIGERIKEGITDRSAQRIILFDKFLLDAFLQRPEEVATASKVNIKLDGSMGFEILPDDTNLVAFNRLVLQAAFYMMAIHEILEPYREWVETIYLDKAHVKSNQFYDFGLYKIDGMRIVYNPIYQKGVDKGIVKEKILLENNRFQAHQIRTFIRDFKNLWKPYPSVITKQRYKANRGYRERDDSEFWLDIKSSYYRLHDNHGEMSEDQQERKKFTQVYEFDYFGKGYQRLLGRTWKALGVKTEQAARS